MERVSLEQRVAAYLRRLRRGQVSSSVLFLLS